MRYDLDFIIQFVNSLIGATRVIFYFAIIAGTLSLGWINFAKKYNHNRYQRLVNVSGIYIISFLIAEFLLPWIFK